MEKVYSFYVDPQMELVDGVPLDPRLFPADHIRNLKDMQLGPEDVLVSAFPKSGTIWTMTTIAAIMSSDNLDEFEAKGPAFARIPIDMAQFAEVWKTISRPTVVYSHLRPHMIPKCNKIIHVMRNPKDIIVSFFHFAQLMSALASTINNWDDYVSNFCQQNNLVYGNWFDYMKAWLSKRGDPNILFIEYEDFVADPPAMIVKLSNFLNKPLTDDKVNRIAGLISFKSMQNNPKLDHDLPGGFDKTKGRFLRKGKVGDWRNHFTDDQNEAFDAFYQKFSEEYGLNLKFEISD